MILNQELIKQIVLPRPESHKGQNGRVLVIGGSELFHAAPFWAAAAASKIVDMVHFSSPYLLNNELMEKRAKEQFWSGIVVPWEEVEHYIEEDDTILIGPGMTRTSGENNQTPIINIQTTTDTKIIVNYLLSKYPRKRWVVDGGALQEVDPKLLTATMIVTPNPREFEILEGKLAGTKLPEVTMLVKGVVDTIVGPQADGLLVAGGNAGMTKGGTGDVLAGVVSALYAKSPAVASCYVASLVNKRVGEKLATTKGTFFDAGEMIALLGEELNKILS